MSKLHIVSSDKIPRVSLGNVILPAHQATIAYSLPNVQMIDVSPPAPTNSLVAGTKVNFDFDPNQLQKVDSVVLRLDISESGGAEMVLCDAPHMIEKIEWQSALKSDSLWYTARGDNLYWEACALPDRTQQNSQYLKELNVSENYGQGFTHTRSKSFSYRIPLVGHVFEQMKHFLGHHVGKMRVVITFRAGCVVSGSGTPQLDNICLEVAQQRIHSDDVKHHAKRNAKMNMHRYLEPIHLQLTTQTFTASTEKKIDLDVFSGKFAFILFGIRADSYAATSNGLIKFVDLGDEATVDLLDASGRSIMGKAVRLSFYKSQVFGHQFDSERFASHRNMYVLPLCADIKKAFAGSLDGGFMNFDGTKIKLSIVPSAAGTAVVQTVNLAGGANAGYYKLAFRGETTNSLAYNTSAANVKVALEALRSFKDYPGVPLTVTASGTAAADFTLTFDSTVEPPQDQKDLVQLISETINASGTGDFSDTSVTTYGKKGFTTGSTYTIDIYGYKFRDLFLREGEIRCADS